MEQVQPVNRPVAGVVLAAGQAKRMGRSKLTLPWRSGTVLSTTLAQVQAAGIAPLYLVTGAYAAETAAIARKMSVPCVHNAAYAAGQSGSLQRGLQAVPRGFAAMFILADQPLIPPAVYAALAEAYRQSDAWLVAPQGPDGRRGNPVIVAPELFAEVQALTGDAGARALFARYPARVRYLPLAEAAIYLDIDTQEDYQCYQQEEESQP